jgi:hypothetical protein
VKGCERKATEFAPGGTLIVGVKQSRCCGASVLLQCQSADASMRVRTPIRVVMQSVTHSPRELPLWTTESDLRTAPCRASGPERSGGTAEPLGHLYPNCALTPGPARTRYGSRPGPQRTGVSFIRRPAGSGVAYVPRN